MGLRVQRVGRGRSARRFAAWSALLVLGLARAGSAQSNLFAPHESLATDRPEAWAMTYFGSALLATGLAVPAALPPGGVELGLEAGWVPALSREERRVGFEGTKEEDLNRSPVAGRLRARLGLPGRLALEAGLVPPIEVDGITPHFYSLGLALALPDAERWRFGLRLHGDFGELTGDFTCPAGVAAAGDDPIANPYSCEVASSDEIRYRILSFEATVAFQPRGPRAPTPYLALALHRLGETFQVDSRWLGLVDRSRLDAEDTTWSIAAGLDGRLAEHFRWSGEAFYSPLSPVRRSRHETSETDGLLNVRLALRYRVR